ncbi:LysE family translocator [Pseudoalteromonas rubra]|uniref:LysE family translocator n=1 Tax=Pseudoalteromonas rubra TaxID=43658 RepID=A0A5S3UZX2_9GAMM|nr:LysE family translocator [Pseudoalteromonas rubra]QPB83786.1 LysE family translocator [Pseudoalteromonas rubra]
MQFESWITFCSIALLATATPGPAALLVSISSISFGFRQSLLTVLGNITGLFIMSGLSVLGLSTVILHSAFAFTIIKFLGALYLIYLGVKLWRHGLSKLDVNEVSCAKSNALNLYGQGLLVALTNPKAIVFTTALFPQFIVVSEPLFAQFSVLVLSFMSLSVLCLSSYAFVAQRAKSKARNLVSGTWLGKLFGSTFIGAGCFLATTSR